MKTPILNHKQVVLILVAILLTLGISASGYGQLLGICSVGDTIWPGESCIDPGTGDTFSVSDDGRGQYLFITAGHEIALRGTINGISRNFVARNRGDNIWLIELVTPGGTTPPLSDEESETPVVDIPDPNLRTAIESALGMAPGALITGEDMARLTVLEAPNANISDLIGLEHAINLERLNLGLEYVETEGRWINSNWVSNLSPLSGLTNLTWLNLEVNSISDLSPVAGLTNLRDLNLHGNNISDLSAVAGLTNLTWLLLWGNNISDLSAVAGLTNLTWLNPGANNISDLSSVAGLTNLTYLNLHGNNISDLSSVAGLTNLTWLDLRDNSITDLSPLVTNTGLGSGNEVYVGANPLSSTSIHTHIPALQSRGVEVYFANLKPTSDLVIESVEVEPSTVDPGQAFRLYATLRNNGTEASAATTVRYYRSTDNIISTTDTQLGTGRRNPLAANASIRRFLDVTAPTTPGTYYYGVCVDSVLNESNTANNCSAAVSITVQGAPVVSAPPHPFIYWTDSFADKIQRANLDGSNIEDLVTRAQGLSYPSGIALDVVGGKMYWTDFVTDKIQRANLDGSNVENLVTQGFASPLDIALDVAGGKMYWTDLGTQKIQRANLDGSNVENLVTQGFASPLDIALDVVGGKMYWTDYGTDKIQRANLDGSNIEDLVTQGLSTPIDIALDVAGGKMYWIDYGTDKIQRANLDGSNIEDLVTQELNYSYSIALDVAGGKMYWTVYSTTSKIQRANLDGSNIEDLVTRAQGLRHPTGIALGISSQPLSPIAREDVNRDGVVDVRDLEYVGLQYGKTGTNAADVNGDQVVNVDDFILVAAAVDAAAAAAPAARAQVQSHFTAAQLQGWLTEARALRNTSFTYQRGIAVIERLLALVAPEETALLANYPNPFNPETWIPYTLANDADVTLTVYDTKGGVVRRLDLGHQAAGYYTDRSRAAYWDGRNEFGEPVASGVFFYHLSAGDYSATRKMVILK